MRPIEESSDSKKECDGGDGGDRDGGKGGGGQDGDALNDSRPHLSIWVLKEVCINQFEGLLRSGKIEFILLGSNQGRPELLDPNHDSPLLITYPPLILIMLSQTKPLIISDRQMFFWVEETDVLFVE